MAETEHTVTVEDAGTDKQRLVCSCGALTTWLEQGDSNVPLDDIVQWTKDNWNHDKKDPDLPPWA